MDDFLVKPFDDRQLAETLQRWVTPVRTIERGKPQPISTTSSRFDAAPSRGSVIDMPVIEGLRALASKGGTSRLERAVSRFVDIAPTLAATIRETCGAGDAEALWRAAHSLKSSAGALGARQLSQRCADIESSARNSGIEAAQPLVEALDDDLTAAIRGLQALIGEMHVPA